GSCPGRRGCTGAPPAAPPPAAPSLSCRCPPRPPRLENVPREVLILEDGSEACTHVVGVDGHRLAAHIGRSEGHLFEQLLHHRIEPPCSDVLRPLIGGGR